MSDESIFTAVAQPTTGRILSRAQALWKQNFILMGVWALLISGLTWVVGVGTLGVGLVVLFFLSVPVQMGLYHACYDQARNKPVGFGTMTQGLTNPGAYILGFFTSLMVVIGLAACVLPGIFMMMVQQYSICTMVSKRTSAIDSIKGGASFVKDNIGLVIVVTLITTVMEYFGNATVLLAALLVPLNVCIEVSCFEMLSRKSSADNA